MEIGTVDKPRVVLVVMAHPDDAEFGCVGTLIRWIDQGCTVHYVLCTSGDKGSKDLEIAPETLVAKRESEQQEAARRAGVKSVRFLRQPDGEFQVSLENRERIVRVIREVRPDVLMTHDPWRRYQLHPDHRNVGICTLDAMVAARDHLYFPHLYRAGLAPHTVSDTLLFSTDAGNVWADIGESFSRKFHALQAHESQVGRIANLEQRMLDRASQAGRPRGVELAEEFHRVE